MNRITSNYENILETLIKIESKMNFLNQIRKSKLSDLELISIDLTSEFMGIDSELDLFRKLPYHLSSRIDRSVYNLRKRNLFAYRDSLRKKIAAKISVNDYYIVDSMPLEICKLSRSSRSTICRGNYFTTPDRGFEHHKIVLIMIINCMLYALLIFTDFDLTQASVHDIHYLRDIKTIVSKLYNIRRQRLFEY